MNEQRITTMQDILDALDQNPDLQHEFHKHVVDVIRNDDELRQDLRKEILTEELLQLPMRFAQFEQNVGERFDKLESDIAGIKHDVASLKDDVAGLKDDATDLKASQRRLERDLGELKGDPALRATRVFTYDIADDMGHRIIRDLSRAETRAMSREQALPHMPRSSLRSFAVADAIIEVTTQDGGTGYIAVEASYTADERDTYRAIRNAHYLRRMTGNPAWAAVSALRVDDRIQHLIDCGAVHWHRLQPEDLATD